ncbi:MAG: zf-HC2 domain-containing protein [Bryobacteraceae bacterium]|nr:zf-HC2 domain-containing protein [Bryobacteraceae bacterium]
METIQNHFHLSSESLEEYVLGRAAASEAARINEHLFECDDCYQRYEQETELLVALRNATPAPQEVTAAVPFWSRLTMPGPLLAGASAVVLLIFFVPRLSETPMSPAFAELSAYRSAGAAISAPANRNLVLRLDTTGLDATGLGPASQFRAEMADSTGQAVWSGNAVQKDGRWEAIVDKRMAPGQYWVRLYAGANSDLLREFSLQLQ